MHVLVDGKECNVCAFLEHKASSVGVVYQISRVLGRLSIHSNFCTKV